MLNTNTKKVFSSANFVILLCSFFVISIHLIKAVNPISFAPNYDLFKVIYLIAMLGGCVWILCVRFPIFVDQSPCSKINEDFCEKKYTQTLGCFKCLLLALFLAGRSQIVSFGSGATITMCHKGRICKFSWVNKPPNRIHRLLDFLLFFILTPILYLIVLGFLSFNFFSGFSIFVLGTVLLFRKKILLNFLSVNVGKSYNYRLKVICPYNKVGFNLCKYYGTVNPFNKTILITEDAFRLNQTIRKYVVAHEAGRLKNKKIFLVHCFANVVTMTYLFLIPWLFQKFNVLSINIPLTAYLVYRIVLRFKIDMSAEFFADSFALKTIGKEKCLEALTLINKDSILDNNKKNLFNKTVSIETKIKFINDYKRDS